MTNTRDILELLASGEISIDQAEKELRNLALAEVGRIGMVDVSREERSGIPEVVLAETKTVEMLTRIVEVMVSRNNVVLLTRANQAKYEALQRAHPNLKYDAMGHQDHLTILACNEQWREPPKKGKIAILTAGTSDIVYAQEAEALARILGVEALVFHDVGVAGIHRLIEPIKEISEKDVDALVVFAGMEGALPTVVASLVDIPVIGVPVPTGYGHGGKGETALASMLQSCAPGLAVVNIGNGLGAGAVACLIAKRRVK
ncbi:MAG: nickel pincer cofactor biosynthesis protein LarB [Candidatus Thorarchaeota archaeon]|nr:nickel pincer cofactor biosynthesis protein LarB [Candidatus Thorarchaeota archaeon]